MSTMMPRSVLRHRPIQTDIPEFIVGSALRTATKPQSPIILIGLSMLATLLLLWLLQGAWSWSTVQITLLRYGSTPTTQVDQRVGHEVGPTLSHFTAMNVHGQIYVLEIPGGDPKDAHLLVGPHLIGSRADLALVQLTFIGNPKDPDLLLEVGSIQVRFHNTGKTYEPSA